jgi:hypothetical protein
VTGDTTVTIYAPIQRSEDIWSVWKWPASFLNGRAELKEQNRDNFSFSDYRRPSPLQYAHAEQDGSALLCRRLLRSRGHHNLPSDTWMISFECTGCLSFQRPQLTPSPSQLHGLIVVCGSNACSKARRTVRRRRVSGRYIFPYSQAGFRRKRQAVLFFTSFLLAAVKNLCGLYAYQPFFMCLVLFEKLL